jgi:hypothetical protein
MIEIPMTIILSLLLLRLSFARPPSPRSSIEVTASLPWHDTSVQRRRQRGSLHPQTCKALCTFVLDLTTAWERHARQHWGIGELRSTDVPIAHHLLPDISAAYRHMVSQERSEGADLSSGPGSAWYQVCRDWHEVRCPARTCDSYAAIVHRFVMFGWWCRERPRSA